jgi:hypothetical protein
VTFPELLEAALTGTQNHVPPGDESAPPERRLLRGASLQSLRWLAGRPLENPELEPVGEPAEPETASAVPTGAMWRLVDILERRPDMLTEWLQLVRERRLLVPPIALTDLLEHARLGDSDERELVVEIGGARMRWLASFNADWRFAAFSDPEEQFTSGSAEQRTAAVRRIRRYDPDRARDLLQEAWRHEGGENRASLLSTLEQGLSRADENLLNAALRDSRREVREVALQLIRRLPESEFATRWIDRAQTIVIFPGGSLVVHEPDNVDSEWIADGLDPRPPKGIGTTAWLLQQILALTPPRIWPADMLASIQLSDWRVPLARGLVEAAEAYADTAWCTRLIEVDLTTDYALELVSERADAWTPEFSRFLLEHLPGRLDKHYAAVAAVLRVAPWQLDPTVLPLAEAWLDSHTGPLWLQPTLERLVATLEYRLAMRRELDPA